jgi:hypothetical protein
MTIMILYTFPVKNTRDKLNAQFRNPVTQVSPNLNKSGTSATTHHSDKNIPDWR